MERFLLDIDEPGSRLKTQVSIITGARDLLSADWGSMITLNPITQQFYGRCVVSTKLRERDVNTVQKWLEGVYAHAREHEGKKASDITDDFNVEAPANAPDILIDDFSLKDTGWIRLITLRTKRENRPMAVLILGFQRRPSLAKFEKDLSTLVSQACSVLENIWLLGRYRAVIKIGQKLNRKLNGYRDLFEKLYEEVGNIIDTSSFFMLAVHQPESNTHDRYFSVENGRPVVQVGMELQGACKEVIKKGRSLKSFYLSKDKEWKVDHVDLIPGKRPGSESVIFEPLIFRGEVLAVLSVQHHQPNAYDEEDIRIIALLGNQVALALSNIRLVKYLETLNEVGQRLTENLTSDKLLSDVADEVRRATEADIVTIYPYLASEERFGQPVYSGDLHHPEFLQAPVNTDSADNIARLTLKRGKPIWEKSSKKLYGTVGGDPIIRTGNFEEREDVHSTAALNLQINNEPIGVMFVNFRKSQRFPPSQQKFIEGLANYAAIAIKNYRKYIDLNQRHYENLIALQKIDREMRLTPGLHAIMQTILEDAVSRVRGADESAIILYNSRTEQLETVASLGTKSDVYKTLALPVKDGQGLTVWAYNNRQAIRVDNVKEDPEWSNIYCPVIGDTLSEMDVPLIDEREVRGVISFESKTEKAFSREDQDFIETLAGQAVLAIRNAQLYDEALFARKELDALHQVAQKIALQQSDPEEVMNFILKQARVLVGAEMGALQLYEGIRPGRAYLSDSNASDGEPIIITIESANPESGVRLGIVQYVAETHKPYITEGDAVNDQYYEGELSIHSEIAVPLVSRTNNLIGVLDLESPRLYAFDSDHLKMLEIFARQAVIAIQNAESYSLALSESERFRLLSEAGRDLGELTNIKQLREAYNIVVAKLAEFSHGEILVRRYEEATQELVLEEVRNPRRLAPPKRISISRGINGQVAREHRQIVVPDLDNPPQDVDQSVEDDPSVRTLAVTPIKFQETRYYGNLVLSHPTPFSITKSDENLLEGLAQQLAITIHRLEMVQANSDLALVAEGGHSSMQIAHRLADELGLIPFYISRLRGALPPKELENPAIAEWLEKVLTDVNNVLNMSSDIKQKVAGIGKELAQERATVPATVFLEETRSGLRVPENIAITWGFADDLAEVNVVPRQILDIIRNLVFNAIEVMPDGGRINIRALNSGSSVRIEVEDDGPGIDLGYQGKIFDLFFSTKKSSGFGLWSAKFYARANGGNLAMRSEPGLGATFVLELPAVDRVETTTEDPWQNHDS